MSVCITRNEPHRPHRIMVSCGGGGGGGVSREVEMVCKRRMGVHRGVKGGLQGEWVSVCITRNEPHRPHRIMVSCGGGGV